jgi:hypothetical protein
MILLSKYNMGQRLVAIHKQTVDRPERTCDACEATGLVDLRGAKYECPACKGTKRIRVHGYGWVIRGDGHVGKIQIEHYMLSDDINWGDDEAPGGDPFSFVRYMLDTTGIGSGSVYDEPNLWPSREEAQAECDRRNGYTRSEA